MGSDRAFPLSYNREDAPGTPGTTVYPPPVIPDSPELTSVFLEKKGGLPQTQKEANLNKEWFEEVGPFIRQVLHPVRLFPLLKLI